MIVEVAQLHVKYGQEVQFEHDFNTAGQYISSINGYIKHTLLKCLEKECQYILLVEWNQLEDHTIGFRNSVAYQHWKQLLHHYYEPFPTVEHYKVIL